MPRETRTRITLFLPAPTTRAQHFLVDAVLTELIQICGGVTASSENPSVFDGWWFDPGDQQVKTDANILILADAPFPPEASSLSAYLDSLKARCQRDFVQDLVWLTVYPIERITTYDP